MEVETIPTSYLHWSPDSLWKQQLPQNPRILKMELPASFSTTRLSTELTPDGLFFAPYLHRPLSCRTTLVHAVPWLRIAFLSSIAGTLTHASRFLPLGWLLQLLPVRQSSSLWIPTLAITLRCGTQQTVTHLPPASPIRRAYLCLHDHNHALPWARHVIDRW